MSIYDYTVINNVGEKVSLNEFKGKVILVVNTASKCGFTPQLEGIQRLYDDYKEKGFIVLAFPCNQFGAQEPGTNEEIKSFCSLNYGVPFPIMDKVDVNGVNESPLFTYLKKEKSGLFGEDIKWNFTKFLIDREGMVVKRFASNTKPEKLRDDIISLL